MNAAGAGAGNSAGLGLHKAWFRDGSSVWNRVRCRHLDRDHVQERFVITRSAAVKLKRQRSSPATVSTMPGGRLVVRRREG